MNFSTRNPESENINSEWIKNFLKRLEDADVAMHSMILMRHGNIVAETYYAPYTIDTPHRMFSITKSFVSLAIGLLEDAGLIHLDDKIIDYFPEKLPENGVHPYIAAMTICDMLKMATCHTSTTYKQISADDKDWVRSFFTVAPSHMPGTCFSYDTSASHVLCALVEKITKTDLLSYLRKAFLDEIGFSKNAYIIKAPMGESMAGSGLVATPRDILGVMYLISREGVYNHKQLLPKEYLKQACSCQISTYAKSQTFEEMQGYGYQIWQTTHDSIAFYGMAGQLAVYSPKKDMILITTADTMGRNGGVQLIYDAYWQEIYDKTDVVDAMNTSGVNTTDSTDCTDCSNTSITSGSNISSAASGSKEDTKSNNTAFTTFRQLKFVEGNATSPISDSVHDVLYRLDTNKNNWKTICLELDSYNGTFTYEDAEGMHAINFGIGCNEISPFPKYNFTSASSGAWIDDSNFLIKSQIIDEAVGNLFILLTFKDDTVTLMMRKYEETMFNEFNGFISGKRL